jgi:Holliday junction resolvase RusA-like endonuclease
MTQGNKWKFKDHPIWGWRERVAWAVKMKRQADWPLACRVKIGFDFKVVPNRGQVGDLDNYIKGCKDALKNILYKNDKQVKRYLEPIGVDEITDPNLEGVALAIEWGEV